MSGLIALGNGLAWGWDTLTYPLRKGASFVGENCDRDCMVILLTLIETGAEGYQPYRSGAADLGDNWSKASAAASSIWSRLTSGARNVWDMPWSERGFAVPSLT
jgi:hypothetical protein